MPDEEITVGEIWRRLDSVERRIETGFSRLDRSLESLQFVNQDVYHSDQRALWAAIKDIQGKQTWVARTIAGALITTAITVLLALLAARGGV